MQKLYTIPLLSLILWAHTLSADAIRISSNPATLTINSVVAGQQPLSVANSSTTYTINTTTMTRSIVGSISSSMPSNTSLSVALNAPPGATSAGAVTMTTVNKNLVTSIPPGTNAMGNIITYTFSANLQAAQVNQGMQTLTLTIQ